VPTQWSSYDLSVVRMAREPRNLTYSILEDILSIIWMSASEHFEQFIQNLNYLRQSSDTDSALAIENKCY
jgi:hypothetical protein